MISISLKPLSSIQSSMQMLSWYCKFCAEKFSQMLHVITSTSTSTSTSNNITSSSTSYSAVGPNTSHNNNSHNNSHILWCHGRNFMLHVGSLIFVLTFHVVNHRKLCKAKYFFKE